MGDVQCAVSSLVGKVVAGLVLSPRDLDWLPVKTDIPWHTGHMRQNIDQICLLVGPGIREFPIPREDVRQFRLPTQRR